MNQSWIEAFLEVSRTGSVSKAAHNLFLTQPTVTSRIQSLEQEIGESLFLRTNRKMQLSQAGMTFLPYAEQLLETWRQGQASVQLLKSGISGEIVIALFYSAIPYFTPCFIEFTKTYPDVQLIIKSRHSEEVGELVLNHIAHIGITRSLSHSSLKSLRLLEDQYVLAVSPDHPDASQANKATRPPWQGPFLVNYSSQFDKEAFQQFLKLHDIPGKLPIQTDNLEVIKHYALNNMGIAFLPRFYIKDELRHKRLIQLEEIPNTMIPARDIEAIWIKGYSYQKATQCLLTHLVQYIQSGENKRMSK